MRPFAYFFIASSLLAFACGRPDAGTEANFRQDLDEKEIVRLITEPNSEFKLRKVARCWRGTDLSSGGGGNQTWPICRALVELGYVDPVTFLPTEEGQSLALSDLYVSSADVYMNIGRRRLRSIDRILGPPQRTEALKDSVRVDFTWCWVPTNRLGEKLQIGRELRNTGSAFFMRDNEGEWRVKYFLFKDLTPEYQWRPLE